MKKNSLEPYHQRDITTPADWHQFENRKGDQAQTPTIAGCDSGQTTDRKEEDQSSYNGIRFVPSEGELHSRPLDKEPSELRLKFKKNLQA